MKIGALEEMLESVADLTSKGRRRGGMVVVGLYLQGRILISTLHLSVSWTLTVFLALDCESDSEVRS